MFDTVSDSIQCLNFAKKWFIQCSIQYYFTRDSIQNIIQFKSNSADSLQKIIQFNSQEIIDTSRIGKVPKHCPKSVQSRQKKRTFHQKCWILLNPGPIIVEALSTIFFSCWTEVMPVKSCHKLWQLLQAAANFDSCYKLLPALTAVTRCHQLWHPLEAASSFDSCYKLLRALTAIVSFNSCYKLSPVLTTVTSFQQLWQPLEAVDSFETFQELLPALTAVTSCRQLWQLLQALDSCYNYRHLW